MNMGMWATLLVLLPLLLLLLGPLVLVVRLCFQPILLSQIPPGHLPTHH